MRIVLPILYNDAGDILLESLGITVDTELVNKPTKDCYFYTIDCVLPYDNEGKEYSEIVSGGKHLICALSPIEVDKLIYKANQKFI